METLILIILLVFGVLQSILFFKIWKMTDDVRAIKNKGNNLFEESQVQVLLGNKQKAYDLLYKSFIESVCLNYNKVLGDSSYTEFYLQIISQYKPHFYILNLGFPDFDKFDTREKVSGLIQLIQK